MQKKIIFITRILFVLSILLLIIFTTAFYAPRIGGNAQTMPNTVRTRAQLHAATRILNVTEDFYIEDTQFASIRFTETDADFISAINGSINIFYPQLLTDFGLSLEEAGRMKIIIFPDQDTLESAVARRYTKMPMGMFFAGIIGITSPTVWFNGDNENIIDNFMRNGPVLHEMVHFVLDVKTNGNHPLWFTEGVALFYEYIYTANEWRLDLRKEASQLCAIEVTTNFREFCKMISYRKVFDIIMNYVSTYGTEGLQKIITELGRGTPYDEVLGNMVKLYRNT